MSILEERQQKVRGQLEVRPGRIQVVKATQIHGSGDERKDTHRLEIVIWDESLRLSVVIPHPLNLVTELADGIEWLRDPETHSDRKDST